MSRAGRTAWILALVPGLWLAAGCAEKRVTQGPRAQLRPDDVVVAKVDETAITARRVTAHAHLFDGGVRRSLDDLVGFELLAAEADRRGLAADPEVAETRTREMVRRLLQAEFEATHRAEDIPEAEVRAQLDRNRPYFDHPEIRNVVTVLFAARRGVTTAKDNARAKATAQELADRWRAEQPADAKTARAIAETYYGNLGGVRLSQFNTYAGAEAEPQWLKVALSLTTPGAVGGPVQTKYGWHVIYLGELTPAKHTPEAEARAIVRKEMFPLWQRAAFSKYSDDILARYKVEVHPERIPVPTRGPVPAPEEPR
jgi:peptidyl-prolyl cis-trans isomerase C